LECAEAERVGLRALAMERMLTEEVWHVNLGVIAGGTGCMIERRKTPPRFGSRVRNSIILREISVNKERKRVRKLLIIREALFRQERKSPEVIDNTIESCLVSGGSLQMKEREAREGTTSEIERP
jgi:hypothetical protein